jgi:hypothetical protein
MKQKKFHETSQRYEGGSDAAGKAGVAMSLPLVQEQNGSFL